MYNFYIIVENFFQNSVTPGDPWRGCGVAGGVLGGCVALGGPRGLVGPVFFCLLCLNNYSKIFQKHGIFKLLIGGSHVGYHLGGAPPGTPQPPQGSPGVTEF